MTDQTFPETKYWGKKNKPGGALAVHKQLLPDGFPQKLSPDASLKLCDHAPGGFQWGYTGSGPAQLALAILFDVTGNPELSLSLYQDFKFDVVASWGDEWEMTSREILEWISKERSRELHKAAASSQN